LLLFAEANGAASRYFMLAGATERRVYMTWKHKKPSKTGYMHREREGERERESD
jgi:hypothetical protein